MSDAEILAMIEALRAALDNMETQLRSGEDRAGLEVVLRRMVEAG